MDSKAKIPWKDRTEREKHSIALFGAVAVTALVTIVWAANFATVISGQSEVAAADQEELSPLAGLKSLVSSNVALVKSSISEAKASAAAIFSREEYVDDR